MSLLHFGDVVVIERCGELNGSALERRRALVDVLHDLGALVAAHRHGLIVVDLLGCAQTARDDLRARCGGVGNQLPVLEGEGLLVDHGLVVHGVVIAAKDEVAQAVDDVGAVVALNALQ